MPGWDDVLHEIKITPGAVDVVRRKYLVRLHKYTGRNIITYHSGWLVKENAVNTDINDSDISGFMNAIKGLNPSQGLDLILHTRGGSPTAAEGIVKYLRSKFGKDIRVIVPQLAMSAGTMIACAAKLIIMGKQSNLGPIDPQFNGIPAFNIKHEFETAKADLLENPNNIHYWSILLNKYPAAFVKMAVDAIDLSEVLVREWLGTCMFNGAHPSDKAIINNIIEKLNEHDDSKHHGRHFNIDFCRSIGLKIFPLEEDQKLQDIVLSVHHAYSHTIVMTKTLKIIENHHGKAMIVQGK